MPSQQQQLVFGIIPDGPKVKIAKYIGLCHQINIALRIVVVRRYSCVVINAERHDAAFHL